MPKGHRRYCALNQDPNGPCDCGADKLTRQERLDRKHADARAGRAEGIVLLAGAEYQRAWFVPRVAMGLFPALAANYDDAVAWDDAMRRAETLADTLKPKED